MSKNDFKAFATDRNANVMSQEEWEALPALLSGFTAGKASSAQVNKAIRQASFIAAALAQYTANKSGLDVLDDGDLNGFISKMGTAFGKDFQALDATLTALAGLATGENKLPYFTGNDTAAQTDLTSVGRDIIGKNTIADILTYLGLHETGFATFTSSGRFIVPAGVTELWISAVAGGGGGGSGGGGDSSFFGGGGGSGGAGESIVKRKFTVVPGSVIDISIGAGGIGSIASAATGSAPTAGGDTVIGDLIRLHGGQPGVNAGNGQNTAPGGGYGQGFPTGSYGGDGNLSVGSGNGAPGASSPFGGGGGAGRAGTDQGTDGTAGSGYGSGGGSGGGKYGTAPLTA
uniref:glycine-rich domain-containing protein n=1 Tax=Escherichia coli TaxID=562 RepID=UPI003855EAE2